MMNGMDEQFKAVIFDMGGVVLRTEDGKPREDLAAKFGLTRWELEALVFQSPHAILAEEGKISEHEHWLAVASELKIGKAELPQFIQQFWQGDRVDEVLQDFITGLRTVMKTGLLSNAWSGARESVSGRFTLLKVFDQVVFSAEVGMRKPARAIFDLVLERLAVKPGEAIFIDDFLSNIDGARDAGLIAIHFKDTRQVIDDIRKLLP